MSLILAKSKRENLNSDNLMLLNYGPTTIKESICCTG